MRYQPGGPGGVIEAKLISGIDAHARYLVIAKVMSRATARAVCTAFMVAVAEYGALRKCSLRSALEAISHPRA
ncbi:MAG: hypothetical protein ACRDRI_12560 [Pseudonocardiaceae bacterium]